jgi:hypothetical protein
VNEPGYNRPDVRYHGEPADRGTCRACPAEILWVRVAKTGRNMPLDPEPREDGNAFLDVENRAVVVGKAAKARLLAAGRDPGPWYVSHFATCPRSRYLDKLTP